MFKKFFGNNNKEVEKPKRITGKIMGVSDRGFAFVSSLEIPYTRIFMHWSSLTGGVQWNDLKKGTEIEFEPEFIEGKGYRVRRAVVLDNKENEHD